MENNVVTPDTAKKLKEAGFPQETYYAWDGPHDGNKYLLSSRNSISAFYRDGCPAAPTAQELADQLPDYYAVKKMNGYYTAWNWDNDNQHSDGDTMAEALAALWLRLNPNDKKERE